MLTQATTLSAVNPSKHPFLQDNWNVNNNNTTMQQPKNSRCLYKKHPFSTAFARTNGKSCRLIWLRDININIASSPYQLWRNGQWRPANLASEDLVFRCLLEVCLKLWTQWWYDGHRQICSQYSLPFFAFFFFAKNDKLGAGSAKLWCWSSSWWSWRWC